MCRDNANQLMNAYLVHPDWPRLYGFCRHWWQPRWDFLFWIQQKLTFHMLSILADCEKQYIELSLALSISISWRHSIFIKQLLSLPQVKFCHMLFPFGSFFCWVYILLPWMEASALIKSSVGELWGAYCHLFESSLVEFSILQLWLHLGFSSKGSNILI